MKKYMILLEEKCSKCHGYKYRMHPAWDRYYNEAEPKGILPEEYFSSYEKIPPEEIECEECGGTGIIEKKIELTKKWLTDFLGL